MSKNVVRADDGLTGPSDAGEMTASVVAEFRTQAKHPNLIDKASWE
jgi:hypothetical protein